MAIIPTLDLDPCGRLAALRAIQDQVVTGGQVIEGEFEQGNGTRRRVKYSAANLSALNRLIGEAEEACNALNGICRPSRFAIGGRMS